MIPLILVLGCHRSGTSTIARSLAVFGYQFGTRLMAASAANPKGYFEDLDLVDLNDAVLEVFGASWEMQLSQNLLIDALSHNDNIFNPKLRRLHGRAAAMLRAKMQSPLVFKDPRLCQLLPFWLSLFTELNLKHKAIFCLRHPMAVALSLRAREGMPVEHGLQLWQRHTQAVLENCSDCLVVDYNSLIKRPDAEIGRIGGYVGANLIPSENIAALKDFIDPQLDHYPEHYTLQETPLPLDIQDLYSRFYTKALQG